jgi:DNA-binding transcriptional MocR family regulator
MSRAPYVSFAVRSERPGHRVGSDAIVRALSEEIRSGRFPAGARLPPVRVLEHQLGISKNTVQTAYDELAARGLLETREREGVFVAAVETTAAPVPLAKPPLPQVRPSPSLLRPVPRGVLSLSSVFVDPELLPRTKLADCMRSILKQPGLEPFYDAQGIPSLREAIAARLRARGMGDIDAKNVVVTSGSQQALDVVARVLEVRRVALESPVYPYARLLFESHGYAVSGLRLDPFGGPDWDSWEAKLAAARPGLFYGITSFHNPTGYSYSTADLLRLLELSDRYRFALLEDDWGSDMLSGSEYRPSLRMLGGSSVIYVNSFTKKLLPSLRLGFLVADESLVPTLVAAKRLSTLGGAWLLEATLAEFLERGYYDTHLAGVQRELDDRYTACLQALRELMPDGVRWTTPGGGPVLWLDVPRSVDLSRLEARMAEHNVAIDATPLGFDGDPHLHGFRLGYAFLTPAKLREGLEILAAELSRAG